MQMHQIRYFLALCEERNFTRAAKRCGVSQPSLTNAIIGLEQELGGALFQRKPLVSLSVLGDAVHPNLAGTWCTQPDDAQGTPMKRCAPRAHNVIRMMPHAIDTQNGRCRVVSVKILSATRSVAAVVCKAQPDRTYGWQFFRDGETLYLTPVGGFVPRKP